MTTQLKVRLIARDDAAAVQRLMESNGGYSERVDGALPGPNAAKEVLTALPPGVGSSQKVDLGLWSGERLVALADVIIGWPAPSVAHIGLLMTDGTCHGQGFGRRMHEAVLEALREHRQIQSLRLSIVDANADAARPFWAALGYRRTGKAVPYSSGMVESVARIWSRPVPAL